MKNDMKQKIERIAETRGIYTFMIEEYRDGMWLSIVLKNDEILESMLHESEDAASEYIAVNWIGG